MSRQIYVSIRDAIRAGRIAGRTRVPPSRTLADDLGVSRTTVVLAYEQLETEGYISGRRSAGTFVADLPIDRRSARRGGRSSDPSQSAASRSLVSLARQSTGLPTLRSAPLPFRIGEPALDLFPTRLWARLYADHMRQSAKAVLGYGGAGGHLPLRAAVASYVSAARGVNASPRQVILTRGTHQALHLAARVLLSPRDFVWIEDPGYPAARALLEAEGASIAAVPVDEDGLVVADGIKRAPRARLAYVSPSHQFPLGVTLSLSRRLALLEWAAESGAWIVEDDYDSEFRYVGSPVASLQGLDTRERVIYVGTFSKTMFPALRLGYMIVPPSLVELFLAAQHVLDPVTPGVEQLAMRTFIEEGYFSRHVRRMRREYAVRQRSLLGGVARQLSGLAEARPTETGMHLIAWLTNHAADARTISRRAALAGVEAAPLSAYAVATARPPALLLGFAAVRPATMGPALEILRRAIETER